MYALVFGNSTIYIHLAPIRYKVDDKSHLNKPYIINSLDYASSINIYNRNNMIKVQ